MQHYTELISTENTSLLNWWTKELPDQRWATHAIHPRSIFSLKRRVCTFCQICWKTLQSLCVHRLHYAAYTIPNSRLLPNYESKSWNIKFTLDKLVQIDFSPLLSQSLHCRSPVSLIIMINKWKKHTRCFLHKHLDFTSFLPAFRPFPVNISHTLSYLIIYIQPKQCSKFLENFKNNGPIRSQWSNQKLVC